MSPDIFQIAQHVTSVRLLVAAAALMASSTTIVAGERNLLSGSAPQGSIIVDYRDPLISHELPEMDADEIETVLNAIGKTEPFYLSILGPDFIFLGRAEGSFTTSEARETAYLIAQHPPIMAQPQTQGELPHLAILDETGRLLTIAPPSPDFAHTRLLTEVVSTDDGQDLLLLESGIMQMGITEIWVDLASVATGLPEILDTFVVVEENCADAVSEGQITGRAIMKTAGGIAVLKEIRACPNDQSD